MEIGEDIGAMTISLNKPSLTEETPEREGAESAVEIPIYEIILCNNRRFCSICMKRKTVWKVNIIFDHEHSLMTWRICWKCMSDTLRRVFRDGY